MSKASTKRVAFVGDVHGHIDYLYTKLTEWEQKSGMKIDAVVQVGDFGVFLDHIEPFKYEFSNYWHNRKVVPIPTYVCMGNHEDHRVVNLWKNQPDRISNLHLMPDGGVTELFGLRIGCVWGNFSPKSWQNPARVHERRGGNITSHNSLKVAAHIDRDAVDRLAQDPGPIDVLITHDAPTCFTPRGFERGPGEFIKNILGLERDEECHGCPGFTALLQRFEPDLYFFGHFHTSDEKTISKTRIICLQALDFSATDSIRVLDVPAEILVAAGDQTLAGWSISNSSPEGRTLEANRRMKY